MNSKPGQLFFKMWHSNLPKSSSINYVTHPAQKHLII
ncbi:unnamed protein product [Rhodiola kirilowii]